MALNLQSAIKITAEVAGLQDLGKLEKGILAADKAAGSLKDGLKSVASSDLFQAAAVGAAALGAAMVISAKAAMDFDSAFADVRKVVSGIDSSGLKEMRDTILKMSTEMPIAATELAKIFAAAGQAGIPAQEIKQFATDVGKISVAFDMTAEEAGTAMAKLRTSLGLSQPEVMSLADSMNHLSDNTASTAKQITEFVLRTGTAGRAAGLTAEQTAAFGAAMVSAGAETQVAATSFNNMIKALSRGESMTERQMSALKRLGLVTVDVAKYEQELTRAVEQESRERLAIAEAETNALRKEIDRRYRDQLQGVNDAFEDETEAYQKSLRDRDKQQVNALQKQQDAEVNAAKARAEAVGVSGEAEVERIKEFYERRIDALRDNTDAELKQRSRADRDRLQGIQDNMNDAKDIELNGLNERFEAAKQLEAKRLEQAKITAKAAAEALSKEVGQTLAKNLQTDAIGTINDVFSRIKTLPREQQISVISDLFGDEARALMPLIQNTELLAKALGEVGNATETTGSVQKEYANRLNTTANNLQLAQNQLNVLAITFGETFAPALIATMKALKPIIEGFTWMIENVPGLGPIIAGLGTAFIGLVAIAPGLASIVSLAKTLGITFGGLKIGAIIAGWLPVIGQIGTALAVVGRVLLGIFTGPVGWAALLITAGVAIYAFRDKIGQAFGAIGQLISQAFTGLMELIKTVFVQPMLDLWNNVLREPITGFFEFIKGVFDWGFKAIYAIAWQIFVQPYINLWNNVLREPITAMFKWVTTTFDAAFKGLMELLHTAFIQPWVNLWNDVLRKPVTAAVTWLQGIWTGITKFFNEKVITPIRTAWTTLVEFLPKAMQNLARNVQNIWTNVVNIIKNAIRGVLQFIANALNGIARNVNRIIQTFNRLPGPDIPYVSTLNVPKFADGGVVRKPTLAMVGEGGQPEYIVPQSKAANFASNYLGGMRGNAAIQSQSSNSSTSPTIQIQTGPVLQQNNQQYVTIADMEKALTTLADSLLLNNRTFGGRSYQGVGA